MTQDLKPCAAERHVVDGGHHCLLDHLAVYVDVKEGRQLVAARLVLLALGIEQVEHVRVDVQSTTLFSLTFHKCLI